MQILNFTELLIKPALQARSKCFTIRKAWKMPDPKKSLWWVEQKECRHKVGALETLMWNQRGKNGSCANCVWDDINKHACILADDTNVCSFSKIFGIGKILETPKIHLIYYPEDKSLECKEFDGDGLMRVAKEDGFKEYADFCEFFQTKYPIISLEWMPFWRIGWDWQPRQL